MLTLFQSIGLDFEFSPVLFVFESQMTHQCASVNIVNDCLEENSEYSNFCLIDSSVRTVFGRYSSTTLVIEDNDGELCVYTYK